MSNLSKTLTFVGVAAVLTGAAVWSRLPSTRSPAAFNDQGQKFFPEFSDPMAAKVLEVVAVDESTGRKSPFQVVQDADGRWRIPSHNDYPADAKDRLGKTAGGVIDLTKDTIRSDDPAEHPALGVVDPEDKALTSLKGVGQRVTLRKSAGGEVLADFIIGKPIPNKSGYRYVRVPGQKRTYGVKVDVDLSARFADWIETNLLKLESSRLRSATFNHNRVDPVERLVMAGEILPIRRPDGTSPWTTDGLLPEQELDTEKLSIFTSALSDLKIVGIRPKPKNLIEYLKNAAAKNLFGVVDAAAVKSIDPRSQQVIPLSAGFYLFQGVGLLPSQAAVQAKTDQGIVYTLYFGEATFAQGEALTAGDVNETAPPAKKKDDKDKPAPDPSTESRYLFATARFDPSLLPVPRPSKYDRVGELPVDVFARTGKERDALMKAETDRVERDREDHDRKLKEGKELADELTARFAAWYYVVPGDALKKLILDRAELVRAKGAKPTPPPGGGFPEGLGLPPGMTFPGGAMPPGHP